mmetsp:Transcript_4137/g.8941  ORF Transcript_4137/g.8941 Transcript_4137/m.8941 type:complete len:231 (+) Transcript_4137:519-1211(+)
MGQNNRKDDLSSRLRKVVTRTCVFRKEEALNFASMCPSWRMEDFLKVSSFALSSFASKGTNEKPATPNITDTTNQINTKHEPSKQITRSGVYFNNREICNAIHPAQMRYDVRHVTKVPNLPVGMPLGKPPRLRVVNHEFLPPIPRTYNDEPLPGKINASPSGTEPSHARKPAKRKKESILGGKPECKPSKRTRVVKIASINNCNSGNKLSNEQHLFFEAAIALSSGRSGG